LTIPKRGDLAWLDFDPQAGREQAKHRPCIVLSDEDFNKFTGFAIVCPITSEVKGLAFELSVPEGYAVHGVVLTDQVKSLDYRTKRIRIVDEIREEDNEFMNELLDTVSGFFSRDM
jgi:mRNA interferase MazF